MPFSEVDISLNIRNNTNYPQQINVMGNPSDLLDTANAKTEYRWDVTTFTFINENNVSVQYKINGASSYFTFSRQLQSLTLQSVVDALNELQIGYFSLYTELGSTYIGTYNDKYTFADLNIFNPLNSNVLILSWDNILNVPVSNPNSVSDWNAFFDTTNYATTSFALVTVLGNNVSLIGGSGLTVKPNLFANNNNIVSVNDNAVIVGVSSQSFFNCNFLTDVTLSACSTIGASSFASCSSLANISMSVLNSVGGAAFNGIPATSISFPLVTTCGDNAFQGCSLLTTVSLPVCITIGSACFDTCSSIISFNLPLVNNCGSNAFSGCVSLITISLPLIVSIGDNGMDGCVSLTSINIPSCLNLGSNTGDNGVFGNIIGNTITLTIPLATSTDGDVVYLQTNNTVTLITT